MLLVTATAALCFHLLPINGQSDNLTCFGRVKKGDTVSPFLGRLLATVELSESHSSCGIKGLAKCGRLAPILRGRLAQTVVICNLGYGDIESPHPSPEGARYEH